MNNKQKHKSFCKKMNNKFKMLNISSSKLVEQHWVENTFEKKFSFEKPTDGTWNLPTVDQLFQEFYQIDELQQFKSKLNGVKSRLNEYHLDEWHKHTRSQDPAGNIPNQIRTQIKAELVTVAWCKFYEILSTFPVLTKNKFNSLHLCEAPGAFIAALNHYLHTHFNKAEQQLSWNWRATTLNPYYEENPRRSMITDDRLILRSLDHWLFHADFTGNLLSSSNILHMHKICKEQLTNDVHLITADGSVDCIEVPDIQEEHVGQLHFAEIISAMLILAPGGNFVIKLFTFFETTTIGMLYLLECAFNEVHVFKPATSKRGNSEVYLICLGFQPETKNLQEILEVLKTKVEQPQILPMFSRAHLPALFLEQVKRCAQLFMNWQIHAIEANIYAFKRTSRQPTQRRRQIVCSEFWRRFKLQPIDDTFKLLPAITVDIMQNQAQNLRLFRRGSYTQRQQISTRSIEEQIFEYRSFLNELEKVWWQIPREAFKVAKQQETVDTDITIGQEIRAMRSSMFSVSDIMLLCEKLEQMIEPSRSFWCLAKPHCELIGKDTKNIEFKVSNISELGDVYHEFLKHLVESICSQQSNTIVFHNIPFLTHFAVSLLFLLTHNYFDNLEFNAEDRNDIKVTLSGGKQLDKLERLVKYCSNGKVLCMVNIVLLHENDFHASLLQYNNAVLLRNVQLILNTV